MNRLRRNPVFAAGALLLGLAALGEAGFIVEQRTAARVAHKRLDQVIRELKSAETVRPSPTLANTALIAAELERLGEVRAALERALRPTGDTAGRFFETVAPERRPEAFFDIATFVEAMRARARQAGVILRADERFGFSSYAHEAPDTSQLAAVFRERQIVQYLLEALLEAKPRQLLSVQRSRPGGDLGVGATGSPRQTAARVGTSAVDADFFEIDPRISARVAGLVETAAFRLSFTGQTDTLRALLTKLAAAELPLLVRAVEVAPAERSTDRPFVGPIPAMPLVVAGWSRFTVVVEFIVPTTRPAAT